MYFFFNIRLYLEISVFEITRVKLILKNSAHNFSVVSVISSL